MYGGRIRTADTDLVGSRGVNAWPACLLRANGGDPGGTAYVPRCAGTVGDRYYGGKDYGRVSADGQRVGPGGRVI